MIVNRKLRIEFVNKKSMYLLHVYWAYLDDAGEVYGGRSIIRIRQFWIWERLFGKKKK